MKKKNKYSYRVIANLDRGELDFLDELAKDIYFAHGIHIPRTKLIEEIIDAFRDCNSLSKKQLEEKLFEQFKREQ